MKKSSIVLFILRLFFYFSVTALVLLHPGITVSYDRFGIVQWFVIIPLEALFAFILIPMKKNIIAKSCIVLLPLLLLSIFTGGFSLAAFQLFCAGLISFAVTVLLFYYPRWARFSLLEPFFFAWVCLLLLVLSRSGEDIAVHSAGLTQFILVWTALIFLSHSIVIYFCLYPRSCGGAGKEAILIFITAILMLFITLIILPVDFIRNTIIVNPRSERIPQAVGSSDLDIPFNRERRGSGRRTIPRSGNDHRPELRGISEHDWLDGDTTDRNRRGSGEGDSRQYTVMVVASKYEPLYMGDTFRGQLDPIEGFLVTPNDTLNQLAAQRLFVSWFDTEGIFYRERDRLEVSSLSILSKKFFPYRPVSMDPTILQENTGPLRYLHQVVSNVFQKDPLELYAVPLRELNTAENMRLSRYLEVPLEQSDRELFEAYIREAVNKWPEEWPESGSVFMETLAALLVNFSDYQYTLNDSGNPLAIDRIKDFLFIEKEGDCVEFSNSIALLGRLAGIPSRIVSGYLVAESTQTIAHMRGLAVLQNSIPVLQQFRFEDLYLVTNLHGHSWVQFYIPDYGWLDFEATAFAIPPVPSGDINNWDVVIPLIDSERVFSPIRAFPWRTVFRAIGILAVLIVILAYAVRYGREAILIYTSRTGTSSAVRALYLLLLARLAADGRPIKPASKTALEYAELFPENCGKRVSFQNNAETEEHLKYFALLYTELRWREFNDLDEFNKKFLMLKQEYKMILNTSRRRGLLWFVVRVFSLRGLAYL